jgi:hypothetical protein
MDPNNPQLKRKILIIASAIDAVLAGVILLIYFGFLPVDISSWGISRSVIGWVGGAWFLIAFGMLVYQLSKPDVME